MLIYFSYYWYCSTLFLPLQRKSDTGIFIKLILIIYHVWSRNSKSQPFYESIWVPDLSKQAHNLGRPLHLSIWHQQRRNHARRWQRRFQRRNVQKYLQVWVTDLDWVSRRDRGLSHVFGHVCVSQFSVAAASKKDVIFHATTSQHMNLDQVSSEQLCDFILCEPKDPRNHQASDCCVSSMNQEITRKVIVFLTLRTNISPGGDCCVNPKDQEITSRMIVVWTQMTRRSPGGWLLCEPKWPRDHQAGDCCVNPKDQEITKRVIVLCEPKGPGDHQAGDCCVNPNDQEITRRVIVVWTQMTRRLPGGWLLCEPKWPGDHQAGDCCVNPNDQEITRRVIVVWTQRT